MTMKRRSSLFAALGLALFAQGCAVYPYPYGHSVAYYGNGPYNGYGYGYQPYGYAPYGGFGWGGGHYWGGHNHLGFGWGGHHGWGGGHGHH
jgi:hypothetical protein